MTIFFRGKRKSYFKEMCRYNHYEVHSHIIPAVDDGAPTMKEALELIDEEIAQGVGHLILTPHLRKNENDYRRIIKHYQALRRQVERTNRCISLYLGSELYYDSTMIERLKSGQAFTMAGSSYVLVEFSYDVPFKYLNDAVDQLMMAGYWPILAHAERYGCVSEHLERVKELIDRGVYIQINAGSYFNHPRKKELLKLTLDGLVHFIGTDCHRMEWRPVCMEETCQYLAEQLEKRDYCRIFFENPQKVLKNEII